MNILNHFILNFFLFCIGLFGIMLNKQNLILILISIEIILLSVNLNFINFSYYLDDCIGQIFSIIILTVAASESAIGLAIIIVFFRLHGNISLSSITLLSK